MTQFLDSGKRVYEYTDEQTTIDDNDLSHIDKSGYPRAKKYKFSTLFNYIKSKFGFGSFENKAFHKAYIKSDSSGFELKGNLEDFTPVTENELTELFVELLNQEDGVLTANKIINIAGLVAQVTRNTSVNNNAPETSKLFYFNPEDNTFATIEKSELGGGENYIYKEVFFEDLLSLGTSFPELLEPISLPSYYDVNKIIFEYSGGAYTFSSSYFMLRGLTSGDYNIKSNLFTDGGDAVVIVRNLNFFELDLSNEIVYNAICSQNGLYIRTPANENPTDGIGSMLVKIWYKVRTFGSEL